MVITGDRDGAEHITGNIPNLFTSMGITFPAFCSLGVLWDGHAAGNGTTREELMAYYSKKHAGEAALFANSLASFRK